MINVKKEFVVFLSDFSNTWIYSVVDLILHKFFVALEHFSNRLNSRYVKSKKLTKCVYGNLKCRRRVSQAPKYGRIESSFYNANFATHTTAPCDVETTRRRMFAARLHNRFLIESRTNDLSCSIFVDASQKIRWKKKYFPSNASQKQKSRDLENLIQRNMLKRRHRDEQ